MEVANAVSEKLQGTLMIAYAILDIGRRMWYQRISVSASNST